MTTPRPEFEVCGRCGARAALLSGWANGMALCHVNTAERPSCYELETNPLLGDRRGELLRPVIQGDPDV